jgi:hypothetical protein
LEVLAELQQLSAELLTVMEARHAAQLINANVDQLLQALPFIMPALLVRARVA